MDKTFNYYRWSFLPVLAFLLATAGSYAQPMQKAFVPDSVIVQASDKYGNPSLFTKILMGKNYRKEWSTPVTLPILAIKALGLTPKELGGGKQTKSLQLVDKDSIEWALRTVDKDVSKVLPKIIRNKFTLSVVQQMISAANPYAPLTIPPLAKAAGVPAASPTFYFVPDDTAFGKFRKIFANTVCLLENRNILPGKIETDNSKKVLNHLLEKGKYAVNQEAYLRARFLDMLIADWDRHYDQWKWYDKDSAGRTYYYALPKDRDQTYFYSQGLLLKFIRLFALKYTVGLTNETSNILKLTHVGWTFDQFLLTELNASTWQRIANEVYSSITDETIIQAVKRMPPPIYAINGATITQKLLDRKKTLPQDVMKYYRFLTKSVTIHGTEQGDHFHISGNRDSITVTVTEVKDESKKIYQRTFYPTETKKIEILGLDGDDKFTSDKDVETSIKIKIDGGTGKNEYNIGGNLKAKASDSNLDAAAYKEILHKTLRIRD